METINNTYNIQRLDEILSYSDGEQFFNLLADSFSSLNADVEFFLKNKAVQSTKLRTSVTYIISKDISDSEIDFAGYFTLASKILRIPQAGLSNSEKKTLKLYSHFDETNDTYNCPAILLAQFGRNFNPNSQSITGQDLMEITLTQVRFIQSLIGGRTVFLECENKTKLIDFYQTHNFKLLDTPAHLSKNNKELFQMYRIF
ncbi:hypothetical protein [uncultured Treponema sp.]|uniref:hypothetical protein n=1 Tax=uncultured Treponema sp. TaxID=162155 RepID=UPI0025E2DB9B|nr:hypothetical protein [uncultured Treponema sp.]